MPIRVLVVDDSAFMRKMIGQILSADPELEVAATARNGADALRKLAASEVDVITLDVEMPVMNGLETLRRIMATNPKPVIMLSSRTKQGSDITLQALTLGAIDFVPKPSGEISLDIDIIAQELITKVKAAAGTRVIPLHTQSAPRPSPTVRPRPIRPERIPGAAETVVAIGSSTGGPRALEQVILNIPRDIPAGFLLIQHMPQPFTKSLAERLNSLGGISVKEAEEGDLVQNGIALLAPGSYHMTVDMDKRIRLNQDPPVQFVRPSVDVTMASLPKVFGSQILGVILTGMGRDGAYGMARIKAAGGRTIAQDQHTSTIYSMPRAVAEEGNADYILPLDRIGEAIVKIVDAMRNSP